MNRWLVETVEPPPIVEFKRKAAAIRVLAPRVFDMSQAVPNVPTSLKLRQRLAHALLSCPETSFYTDVPGLVELRARIAATHPLSSSLSDANIVVTAGANHAMFTAFMTHFKAGDRVVLPEPYYFNYDMGLRMLGIDSVPFVLDAGAGFVLDAARLIAHLAQTRPQGVVLITPNNPTGARYPAGEILRLLEWTSGRGIEVILDETYARYDKAHLAENRIGQFVGNGLTIVGSFSKTYSLTGYRVGYIAAGTAVMEQVLKVQDTLVICAPHLSQLMALYGMESGEADLAVLLSKTADLTELFSRRARELGRFRLASCGAFFAYLEHPLEDLDCDAATLELYRATGILGLPGTVFGRSQFRFIRLAFCNLDAAGLDEAIAGLLAYDRTIKKK